MPIPPADPTPDHKDSSQKNNVWVQVGRYSQLALLLGTAGGLIELIRTALRDSK
jgi:hypothetical protein